MNLKVLNNLFLLKAKNKIKKYVANISINNYYKLLNNKYQDNKKIDQLCTDNNTFSEFKNEFSEFQQQLLINK
jgi:ribosomal protein S17E